VNAHREAAQFNGIVSGRPASGWGKATARIGPPDTTFFINCPDYRAKVNWRAKPLDIIELPGKAIASQSERFFIEST